MTLSRADDDHEKDRLKVLVTGGAGFIGSHIVDAYVNQGYQTVVLDDLSTGHEEQVNADAVAYNASVVDLETLEAVFANERPQIVNHHAAQTSVRRSMSNPSYDARVNIVGSINILQLCVKYKVEHLIFASSCAVYSEPRYVPMDEDHPVGPGSAYGLAKYTVENYVRLYGVNHGLSYVVFRYGNVYGPRQDPEGEAGVVGIFTRQLLNGIRPTIYGDGTKTRDYIYVDDVVRANLLATRPKNYGEVLNLARGVEVTDLEIFEAVRKATNVNVEPIYGERRSGEAERVSLDSSKAREILHWSPKVTLTAGVRRLVSRIL